MNKRDEDFLQKLKAMFREEAEEHITVLYSGLIELEKFPAKSCELVESIYREVHTLKGASRSVDNREVESICQVLEDLFSILKNDCFTLNPEQFDFMHQVVDIIPKMVSDKPDKKDSGLVKSYIQRIKLISEEFRSINHVSGTVGIERELVDLNVNVNVNVLDAAPENKSVPLNQGNTRPVIETETVRISTHKLDPLLLQAEQLIQTKIAGKQRVVELREINEFVENWQTEVSKQGSKGYKLNERQRKELVVNNVELLKRLEEQISDLTGRFIHDQHLFGKAIDEHLEAMKKVLMLPVDMITASFAKLNRDLTRKENKEIELVIKGGSVEVDKRILENLKDPLIHILRNSIDHGIENTDERKKQGKALPGKIEFKFKAIDGRFLEIIVQDDGRGIDTEQLLKSALKLGDIGNVDIEELKKNDLTELVFKSGVTTSPFVTDISGRGLGLAIVKEKVEKLGGKVTVSSIPSKGTKFHLVLPLTLSIYRGVLVRTGKHLFYVPSDNVKKVVRMPIIEVKAVENKETINYQNQIITVVDLSAALNLNKLGQLINSTSTNADLNSDMAQFVIVSDGIQEVGFKVDAIVDEDQILIKDLGKQLRRVRNISGAALLGSGELVPVINAQELITTVLNHTHKTPAIRKIEKAKKIPRILVVEDSITSRTLLRDIIELAGYSVETAIDGADGYVKIQEDNFDLIVTDVDMPRLNGFELTAKIRKNNAYSNLPVVLVTALESPTDRERGIDVGADAYIVKSSFNQSNLVEVINKLV